MAIEVGDSSDGQEKEDNKKSAGPGWCPPQEIVSGDVYFLLLSLKPI